jgi:hypothetical protein
MFRSFVGGERCERHQRAMRDALSEGGGGALRMKEQIFLRTRMRVCGKKKTPFCSLLRVMTIGPVHHGKGDTDFEKTKKQSEHRRALRIVVVHDGQGGTGLVDQKRGQGDQLNRPRNASTQRHKDT